VGVGDDQLDAGQAALDQRAQEVAPEDLGLGLATVKADHLAPPRVVDALRDDQALPDDPAAVSDLLHLGVQPQIRIATLQRARAEGLHLLVKARADARHL
jgi:hypothetical protein